MSLDQVRQFCRSLPEVAEDIKWGNDLVFTIGGRMFCVVCLEPPHQIAFKCTPEAFAELVEQPGLIPAPYLARAMWVQEPELGAALGKRDREQLIRTAYDIIKAKLPKRRTAGKTSKRASSKRARPRATGRARKRR
jgi:predicted DNA-binding protein (MmcQ/YjbR family)